MMVMVWGSSEGPLRFTARKMVVRFIGDSRSLVRCSLLVQTSTTTNRVSNTESVGSVDVQGGIADYKHCCCCEAAALKEEVVAFNGIPSSLIIRGEVAN